MVRATPVTHALLPAPVNMTITRRLGPAVLRPECRVRQVLLQALQAMRGSSGCSGSIEFKLIPNRGCA